MARVPKNPRFICYFGCDEGGPLHHFPIPHNDLERFDVWKGVLDTETKTKGNQYIYNQVRLCDKHFESYYKSPSRRLTRNAVPTLHINDGPTTQSLVEAIGRLTNKGSLTDESSRPSEAATPVPQTSPLPMKKKKQSSSLNTDEHKDLATPGLATPHFKEPMNELDIIAKGWAKKLSRLTQDQRRYAEEIINDTLLEAEMGTLTRNGVVFLSSSSSSDPLYISPAPPVAASENCADTASHTSDSSSASHPQCVQRYFASDSCFC